MDQFFFSIFRLICIHRPIFSDSLVIKLIQCQGLLGNAQKFLNILENVQDLPKIFRIGCLIIEKYFTIYASIKESS